MNIVPCLLYMIMLVLVGNWNTPKQLNTRRFLVSDQNTGYYSLTATLVMTTTNTGLLLAFSTFGYTVGFWALSLPFIFLLGLIFYTLTVSKHWKISNNLTAAHYFADRFNKRIGLLAAYILFISMIGFSATYIKSLALIFHPMFSISMEVLSLLITFTVLLIVARGGLQAVIRTDILSFISIVILLVSMLYQSYDISTDVASAIPFCDSLKMLKPTYVFSLFILTGFSYILSPAYSQKLVAARTPRIAKYSVISAAIVIYVLYAVCIIVSYSLKLKGIRINSADSVFPAAMKLLLAEGWLGLGYGILFSIGATTLTGVWTAMVSLLMFISGNKNNSNPLFLTCICAGLSLVVDLMCVDNLLEKIVLANIPIVALSFALLGGIYWNKTSNVGVLASILTGCVGASGAYLYYGEEYMYTWYWAIYIIPLIFFVGFIFSVLFPNASSGVIMLGQLGEVKEKQC
jgi:SSS family solute:Na+ symporter